MSTNLSDRSVVLLQQLISTNPTASERYTLHEMIGRGGMGTVYRAHDEKLQRDVAFKVLDERFAISVEASARLRREASILARLEHPGIVPVYDVGDLEDGRAFHVMRLVRGERLDEHVRKGIRRGDFLRLMLRLCETVAFAHARGIVHRDLKPSNIMVGPFGEVLVLDWGIAKVLSDPSTIADGSVVALASSQQKIDTRDGAVVGTPGYMAPEQYLGKSAAVDQTADVYALGVIMHELLAHGTEAPSRSLDAIAQCAASSDRAHRYASAEALADDIRKWLDGQSVSAYRENVFERLSRGFRRHQAAVLLVVTYLVVRTVILLWRHI